MGASKKLGPMLISATFEACNFKFARKHHFGLGVAYEEKRLRPKLAGIWAKGTSEKIGTPIYFCSR